MTLEDGSYSLKLECAIRELGFVDIGWKCVAHAGLYFVQPFGVPEDPESDLLGFHIFKGNKVVHISATPKKALDLTVGEYR